MKNEQVVIVGGGPCGMVVGKLLAQQGYRVTIFDRRPDPRDHWESDPRSINMTLSERGLYGLLPCKMMELVLKRNFWAKCLAFFHVAIPNP